MIELETPSRIWSADAAGQLQQAIKFMVTTFLNDGLVQRAKVVSLLENIIQGLEKDPDKIQSL